MPVHVTTQVVGLDRLQRGLNNGARALPSETHIAMTAGLTLLEGEMRSLAPRDTGRLQGSIHHTITGSGASLTGKVGPSVAYAIFVEKGTRAHYPPIGAISGWARRHGVHPFLIARAIGRRGTRAQPFVQPAFDKHRGAVMRLFERIGMKVVARIVGG